jgi:hypothetical protein
MEIKNLTKKYEKNWFKYVDNNKSCTVYHTLGWKRVIEEVFNYKQDYLIAINSSDEIKGIFPLFRIENVFFKKCILSLPFSYIGGPTAESKDTERV